MPYKARQIAERNGGDPQKQDIRKHQEFCIPAAPQYAFCENRVHGLKDDDHAHSQHQLFGNGFGFPRHIVAIDHRPAENHNKAARQDAYHGTEPQESDTLPLCPFCVPRAKGMASDIAHKHGDADTQVILQEIAAFHQYHFDAVAYFFVKEKKIAADKEELKGT